MDAVDVNSPNGSVTYTRDANGDPTSENVTYDPATQQYINTTGDIRNSLASTAQGLLGSLPTTAFTGPSQGNQDAVTKALYDKSMSLLQPQFDQQNKDENVSLSERGIPIGSEIYTDEMNRNANTQDQASTDASNNATLAGGQQYTQDLQNALALYNAPFNTISALLQGTPAPATEGQIATPTLQAAAPNVEGDINSAYQDQLNTYNSQMQGLFGLGSAAIGLL